ncbi:MAG: hypothetical protein KF784_02810 [Fimbriimonadaceae bacterium]|nr:hypothetical protein [Fimbriimonadaceae bacterium]
MNTINGIRRILALLAVVGMLGFSAIASAHEADCPYCKLKIVQNTKEQDNEVVLKMGNKRIEYRCVYCVFKDQGRYKSDLVVYAPSEKIGEPVVLKRTNGKWSAPESTVFLNTFKKHADCSELSRAFSSRKAFDKYVEVNAVKDAKALTLEELIAIVAKPAG